jgi:negative regulator of sigma-B (phosphoserine phosphatase)
MSPLEWGWAGDALESVSGDLHVVAPFAGGMVVALLDGLGHGPEAADASQAAVPVLQEHAGEPVDSLIRRCHEALRKTRGAVMSVASFDARTASLTWTGVGNVAGLLLRANAAQEGIDVALSPRAGVVGYQLPPLRIDAFPVWAGDVLIFATDGIRSGFTEALARGLDPQAIADSILARFCSGRDDAHVVVARYLGDVP